ncbi:MAG: crosslink repair DNA glycosylase YcaQ family protein [Chloroflexota bacterium]
MTAIQITPTIARRLAISAQKLSGPYPNLMVRDKLSKTKMQRAMKEVLQQIRCLQLDPIRAVERTQYLVLWSRLGNYDREVLHELVYGKERFLFEYWAHAASLVLTEDYPIHQYLMRGYGQNGSSWSQKVAKWVADNQEFKQYVLREIEERGALLTQDFEDRSTVPWSSGGWSSGRSVGYMLDYLWTSGELMVAQRDGLKRWWDLTERVLPAAAALQAHPLEPVQVTYQAAQYSLKSLGVARQRDITKHFTEGRYPELKEVWPTLLAEEKVLPIEIEGWDAERTGEWFIHADMLPSLKSVQGRKWKPRTTLLSPFDHLIRDRDRTELMWDFYYRIEIYVPKAKRQYGYYVLPILHGDRLIGRIDPRMDRKKNVLTVNNVYFEEWVERDDQIDHAVKETIEGLGLFLGAEQIVGEGFA